MQIDPSAVLALLSDLTAKLAASENENAQLRAALQSATPKVPTPETAPSQP